MMKGKETISSKHIIYVGLSDGDTYEQKFDTEAYIRVIQNACKGYHLEFTIGRTTGGYFHENGTYVQENSLVVTLIGAEESVVDAVAADLCAFFNQEEVIIEKEQIRSYTISEKV